MIVSQWARCGVCGFLLYLLYYISSSSFLVQTRVNAAGWGCYRTAAVLLRIENGGYLFQQLLFVGGMGRKCEAEDVNRPILKPPKLHPAGTTQLGGRSKLGFVIREVLVAARFSMGLGMAHRRRVAQPAMRRSHVEWT